MSIIDLNSNAAYALAALSIMLTLVYVYLILKAINGSLPLRRCAVFFIGFLFSLAGIEALRIAILPFGRTHVLFRYMEQVQHLPFAALAVTDILLTAVAVIGILRLYQSGKNQLTPSSLQEGMDNLPDGIIYAATDGIPLLVNKTMQQISKAAFGTAVFDVVELENRFKSADFINGSKYVKKEGVTFLILADGTVWRFVKNEIKIKKQTIYEIIAYNVTELYGKSLELEKRNQHLDGVNKMLKKYSRDIDKIIREKEILTAKINLHNDLGNALLMLRSNLSDNKKSREELYEIWSLTVAILRREAESPKSLNELEILTNAAEAVGVELRFVNEIPDEIKNNKVFTDAIHECITNTVKHADGSRINISFSDNSVEFTNDGNPPSGEIKEKGGLINLRSKAEANGIAMTTKGLPRFLLRLTFPTGTE